MGDWEDEETNSKVVHKAWDDEDNDAVPDAWDAEEKPKESKPKAAAPQKVTIQEKKRLKEEKAQQVVEEMKKKDQEKPKVVSEREREKMSEEAELELIQDSFGPSSTVPSVSGFDFGNPKTKEDFNIMCTKLIEKLQNFEISPHYSKFAEVLIRQISLEVDLDTLKDISTSISALITEKQKLVKSKSKKKASKTSKLIVERANDFDYVDDANDEFDDFM